MSKYFTGKYCTNCLHGGIGCEWDGGLSYEEIKELGHCPDWKQDPEMPVVEDENQMSLL